MSKFEVGDKVTPKQLDGQYHPWITLGGVYTVINILNYGLIDITEDFKRSCHRPNSWNTGWSEDWFKLYEEKETEMALTSTMNAEQIRDEILRIDAHIEEAKKDIENAQNERNSLVEKLREKGFELGGTSNQYIKLGDRVEITGWSKERHEKSHIGRKGIIEKIDNTDIPFKVILDDENEDSNTWFEANQVKKI